MQYQDEYGNPLSVNQKEEREISDFIQKRWKAKLEDLIGDSRMSHELFKDIKTSLKEMHGSYLMHERVSMKMATLVYQLNQIDYAEETDDFSSFKGTPVNRGNTEEWRFKLESSIEYAKARKNTIWGEVNLIKNKLLSYYFLMQGEMMNIKQIYQLLSAATEIKTYRDENGYIKHFENDENSVALALNRCADALEKIANKVDKVAAKNILNYVDNPQHDLMDKATQFWFAELSPENNKIEYEEYEYQRKKKQEGRKE